ncbi:MAG: hypothetical protein ABIT71_25315 [Vicinamibacteraceae bacterium]
MTDPVQAPAPLRLVFAYFWAIGLAITAANYVKARRSLDAAMLSPDRKAAGQRYLRTFAIMSAIPLAVIGLGQQLGYTPTVFHYFRPQDGNPFVFAFLTLSFLQACVLAWWVVLADGAATIEELGLWAAVGPVTPPTWVIKLMAGAGPFFILLWIGLVSQMDAPILP